MEKLRNIVETPWDEYRVNEDLQALAERHLHIVLESILDLAAFIAARKGVSRGPSYREVVESIIYANIVPRKYSDILLAVPGMRNILVHGYAEIRHDIIYDTLRNELDKFMDLVRILWGEAEKLDP
ncbi:protein of unknown function DUF86 [Staphylothermus marinus F1]|uniref:DUF86 domain-containing protein n=1 Tax=Staphylothermus marinus (strain ATCC 43588 / DSM 3639 / JCM 9404 / F1) TaxID=399550 RepID=A3DPS4_STAMF|nr:DUF86 domain-containing protein [Staphylothermus marinus]ABN70634.1 protein of unknown function DUF86 [Staphylothermus marinus F1]